ncbi:glycoside hydrolase family 9 protein [Mucilaginibacter jinjuensis]|uniref:Endoglucanase n=1 Tax=Mucilaginibacter jinjuensis TaxID=1176721 RepID=A0ABY7T2N9_9SPHI|nr:glycoside hydrolase family 9 protein [Mucilaginibacter jinjuensis]WCT10528.1 glycoside hydrolase family 9 protein [Mucilaginibacter jinjuensis]
MKFRSKFSLITACLASLLAFNQANAQNADSIRLNQIGFYPNAPKKAIILNTDRGAFYIETGAGKKVFTGSVSRSVSKAFNGKYTGIANFSALNTPGTYKLVIPQKVESYTFSISNNALKSVADGAIKGFYYIRASTELKEQYAGKWYRAAGHPDDKVLIHSSAASKDRKEGTVISSPGGWYDAGDYNKYIVNSGISTATLLSLYEDFPAYMQTVKLNIPESNDKLPDVLNEVLWNLRWMLTMQDPADGGVYHKLTNAAFDGMVMPDQTSTPRYVVQKGTAATLDFAAVMAQASRIFAKYPQQLPGLADSCQKAAIHAWEWAVKNPTVLYNQDKMNKTKKPQINTGAYGDNKVDDEFVWAACELLVTTKNNIYTPYIKLVPVEAITVPTWSDVRTMGYYTLLKHEDIVLTTSFNELPGLEIDFLKFADNLVAGASDDAYQTVIDKSAKNFGWGSNSVAANQGMALILAYKLNGDQKYLDNALANLDYLLGRNGTGYCYLTGFGDKQVMHPHHRPSVADGIEEPVPGLLAGGPNPGMQDKIPTASKVPDEAYIDDDRAYAVNEIAINWNAPFVYLANAIQAIESVTKKNRK